MESRRRVLLVSHRGAMPAFDDEGHPVGRIDFFEVVGNQYALLDVDRVDEGDAGALARQLRGTAAPEAELPSLTEAEDGSEAHAHGDEEAVDDGQEEAALPRRAPARVWVLGFVVTAASVAGVSALLTGPPYPETAVAFALAAISAAITLSFWFWLLG